MAVTLKVVVGFLIEVDPPLSEKEVQKRFLSIANNFVPKSKEITIKQKAVIVKPQVIGELDNKLDK